MKKLKLVLLVTLFEMLRHGQAPYFWLKAVTLPLTLPFYAIALIIDMFFPDLFNPVFEAQEQLLKQEMENNLDD